MGQVLEKAKSGMESVGRVILPPTSWYEDLCVNLDLDEDAILEVVTAARGELDLASVNSAGQTALHNACEVGHSRVLALFLAEPGAQVDCADGGGNTGLMLAAANGQLACVRTLVEAGADRNRRNTRGFSALDMAGNDACAAAVRGEASAQEMEARTAAAV
jgi:hypothetical protein